MNLSSDGDSERPAVGKTCLFWDLDAEGTGILEGPKPLGFIGTGVELSGARSSSGGLAERKFPVFL